MILEFPTPASNALAFTHSDRKGVTTFALGGQLVVGNRQDFKAAVLDLLERGARRFVFDFSSMTYMDSSGLGVLVALSKKILEAGGTLDVRHLNEDLTLLFTLTGLTTVFTIDGRGPTPPLPRLRIAR